MRHSVMRNAPVQEIHSTVCSQLAGEHWAALWLANMSAVWKYFTLETPQSKTAKCNVCKAIIQRGGSSLETYNTTNTIKHLKKQHVKEHIELLARGQKDERSHQESLLESFQKHGVMTLWYFFGFEFSMFELNFDFLICTLSSCFLLLLCLVLVCYFAFCPFCLLLVFTTALNKARLLFPWSCLH